MPISLRRLEGRLCHSAAGSRRRHSILVRRRGIRLNQPDRRRAVGRLSAEPYSRRCEGRPRLAVLQVRRTLRFRRDWHCAFGHPAAFGKRDWDIPRFDVQHRLPVGEEPRRCGGRTASAVCRTPHMLDTRTWKHTEPTPRVRADLCVSQNGTCEEHQVHLAFQVSP